MPQLFCVLEEGGRSLLTRAQGDIQTPSFPTVGLLSSIATFAENSGHELRVIASSNVRVVYRRFENHLLFVLVTSNLLLQTELLQLHLQTLLDALLLLLGSAALALDTSAKIDVLKKRLRATSLLRAIDSLIADDTLVPCILLPVPQLVGLPLRDRASLQQALGRVAGALGCSHAALFSEGYYLAATHAWWSLLAPREQLLLQHLVTQQAGEEKPEEGSELLVHVARRQYEAPLRLKLLELAEGVQLAVLFEAGGPAPPSLEGYEDQIRLLLQNVGHAVERPVWLSPPVPQFASIAFDLALVLEHCPASATLLWGGHSGSAQQAGFNPLMSPTLRKQMGNATSPMIARWSHKPPSAHRDDPSTGGGDGLQLFFRSAVDTLVSFVLQAWPHMPPALRAALHEHAVLRMPGAGGAGGGGGGGGGLQSMQSLALRRAASAVPPTASGGGPSPGALPPGPHRQASALLPGQQRPSTPASRLGGGRRSSSSAPSSPLAGPGRLQALFGRGNAAAAEASASAASTQGAGGEAEEGGEGLEWGDESYEEVHSVVEGARLLALLDRNAGASVGSGGGTPGGGGGGGGPGGGDGGAVDVFMAFPRRVSRVAALEAALTLRATYMMSYHVED